MFEQIKECFPEAPVFTLVADKKFLEKYETWKILTSRLQKIYEVYPVFQHLLPLIPAAVKSLNFEGYDLVISSSSSFVKNIKVPPNCKHICYCHTPTRFLWTDKNYIKQEVPFGLRWLAKIFFIYLRKWDYNGAQTVTKFIANSEEVKKRIKKVYHRDSEIIYPGIDTDFWHPTAGKKDYFLIAGRLQAHKNNGLIIEIFNELGLSLRVVGTGRQEEYLKSIAKPNIKFLGRLSDEQLRDEYSSAKALIYPQIEDFGLMPLEAAACATPTLGIAIGGSLETIKPGVTGEFFESYDKNIIKELILNWKPEKYSTDNLRSSANNFSIEKFKYSIISAIN